MPELDVKPVALTGAPATIAAIAGGSVNLGYGDFYSFGAAVANGGFNLKIIGGANGYFYSKDGSSSEDILVLRSSNIRKPADLVGKRIAVNPSIATQLVVRLWLKQNGVDPSKLQIVPMVFSAMGQALTAGHVDAVLDLDPLTQTVEAAGGIRIASPLDVFPKGAVFSGFFGQTEWIEAHQDVARTFMKAYWKAATAANAMSSQDKAALFAKFSGVDLGKIPNGATMHWWPYTDGPITLESVQPVMDQIVEAGYIKKNFSIAPYLSPIASEK